jgi:8-oxo-dGTP diphosphatase
MERKLSPAVGVGCIVVHDGSVLLVRNHTGRWSTPGGHLDFGESPAAAAARETLEETGVRVRDVAFVAITNDVMHDARRHYVTLWFRGNAESAAIAVGDTEEITAAGWFSPDDLPEPRHLFFDNLLDGNTIPSPPLNSPLR